MTLELRRQLFHIGLGTILTALYYIDVAVWWVFLLLLLFCYVVYYLRKRGYAQWTNTLLRLFDRKKQIIPGWGAFALLKGFLIACVLFPKDIALAAMIILTFGDGISTLVGVHFGKHRLFWNQKKTVEGTFSGLVAAFVLSLLVVSWEVGLIGSVMGMFVETVKKPHDLFDDNILMPLISGAFMLII